MGRMLDEVALLGSTDKHAIVEICFATIYKCGIIWPQDTKTNGNAKYMHDQIEQQGMAIILIGS